MSNDIDTAKKWSRKLVAFTLSEVLITLGIIGVVASMTIPTLITNYEEKSRITQFKKMYSNLTKVWKMAKVELGFDPQCYYWGSFSPYDYSASCEGNYDETGECTGYYNAETEGSLDSDFNGKFAHCTSMGQAIIKNLKVIKYCNGNAYENGCIPDYPGNDTIVRENHTGEEEIEDYDVIKATTGTRAFRKNNIATQSDAYVLADGSIIISYGTTFQPHIFAIDVNGVKGPNKWGYDLFDMRTKLDNDQVSCKVSGGSYAQKGGQSSSTILTKISKNKI